MNFFRYIDTNCERLAPGLWGEPLNMLSNIAFVIALVGCSQLYRSHIKDLDRADYGAFSLLVIISMMIMGSMLFHSFSQSWSLLADVVPIILFIIQYLILFSLRVLQWSLKQTLLALLIFVPLAVLLPRFYTIPGLGLTNLYLPALFVLLYIMGHLAIKRHPATMAIAGCAVMFALSLTLRTVDKRICDVMPTGTHFLWHVLNAMLIYTLMRVLLIFGRVRQAVAVEINH